jgi:4'-phosphopantetheinyl transferase EntD
VADRAAARGVVATAVAQCPDAADVVVEEGPVGDVPYEPSEDEVARMRPAVEKRHREFYAGRYLATVACARLGRPRPSLPHGNAGEPLWPAGVTGSITHCDTWVAVALATTTGVTALGVDVEPARPLPDGIAAVVGGPDELRSLAALPPSLCPDRLLFCVKEAVFKAWYPMTGRWLDFGDVDVRLARDGSGDGTWVARGGRDAVRFDWTGGWSAGAGLLATAVVVNA